MIKYHPPRKIVSLSTLLKTTSLGETYFESNLVIFLLFELQTLILQFKDYSLICIKSPILYFLETCFLGNTLTVGFEIFSCAELSRFCYNTLWLADPN